MTMSLPLGSDSLIFKGPDYELDFCLLHASVKKILQNAKLLSYLTLFWMLSLIIKDLERLGRNVFQTLFSPHQCERSLLQYL